MPSELSGGMARRVALARAIALDPMLVMYDEPFAGLDPISLGVVGQLIRRMSDALGITSLVVTHDIYESLKIVDYLYFVSEGKIIAQGTPAEVRASGDAFVRQFVDGDARRSRAVPLSRGAVPLRTPCPCLAPSPPGFVHVLRRVGGGTIAIRRLAGLRRALLASRSSGRRRPPSPGSPSRCARSTFPACSRSSSSSSPDSSSGWCWRCRATTCCSATAPPSRSACSSRCRSSASSAPWSPACSSRAAPAARSRRRSA